MPENKQKTARDIEVGAKTSQRAVFDIGNDEVDRAARGREFWEGPAGWVLVLLMVVAGVAGIIFTYNTERESPRGSIDVRGAERLRFSGDPSGWISTVVLSGPRSPVDGTPLIDDGTLEYFAVMIDNYSVARPAAGIDLAPLVIESPVEGGITRLMALFLNGVEQQRIGPVRSARPYFVEWAEEYGAVLAHVGGSPQALDLLTETKNLRSINQMQRGGYFWRDQQRDAPHNVFTSTDLMRAALEKLDETVRRLDNERPFKQGGLEGKPPGEALADQIVVDYSVPTYRVTWSYDEDSNLYLRHQGRGKVETEAGDTITADNVIVQITDMKVIDYLGRKEIRTLGDGEALVFRDGRVINARWSKENGGRTQFLFPDSDKEVPLNVGTTWLQVAAVDTPVVY